MPKNIILCADGTGNMGGYTPSSNVYKTYNAIKIHDTETRQLAFYDNGVGTEQNRYLRGITGSVGLGFERNVCDLYEYLAKHYEPDDRVFIFGFSRGAATVRAFSGFVAAAGLIDGHKLSQDELEDRVLAALKIYRSASKEQLAEPSAGNHGAVPIHFIGVWDTVAALGFPQSWSITGIGMWVLNGLSRILDHVSDVFFPHRYHNYELTPNVECACQALAVDDARQSFRPMVWDESRSPKTEVEQVWFAGAHSNVGGGYERAGMADVALEWMMLRAQKQGLIFKDGAIDTVHGRANVEGRLYDSRDGAAVLFRYSPRNLTKICKGQLRGAIRIHDTVLERMRMRTANYAPGQIPYAFERADSKLESSPRPATSAPDETKWKSEHDKIERWVWWRRWLYGIFLESVLAIVGFAFWFWINPPPEIASPQDPPAWTMDWLMSHVADVLRYFTPQFFDGLTEVGVVRNYWIFIGFVVFTVLMVLTMKLFRRRQAKACIAARNTLLESC